MAPQVEPLGLAVPVLVQASRVLVERVHLFVPVDPDLAWVPAQVVLDQGGPDLIWALGLAVPDPALAQAQVIPVLIWDPGLVVLDLALVPAQGALALVSAPVQGALALILAPVQGALALVLAPVQEGLDPAFEVLPVGGPLDLVLVEDLCLVAFLPAWTLVLLVNPHPHHPQTIPTWAS